MSSRHCLQRLVDNWYSPFDLIERTLATEMVVAPLAHVSEYLFVR